MAGARASTTISMAAAKTKAKRKPKAPAISPNKGGPKKYPKYPSSVALATARASALLGSAATVAMQDEVVSTMSRIDPAAYKLGAEAVWLADQRDRVLRIDVPTLVLCGDEDAITPPALSVALQAMVPDAIYEEIAAAGHLTNLEQPEAFNREVDGFLSKIDGKASRYSGFNQRL